MGYVQSFEGKDGDGIPELPEKYRHSEGRQTRDTSLNLQVACRRQLPHLDRFCRHYICFGAGDTDNLCADKNNKKKRKVFK